MNVEANRGAFNARGSADGPWDRRGVNLKSSWRDGLKSEAFAGPPAVFVWTPFFEANVFDAHRADFFLSPFPGGFGQRLTREARTINIREPARDFHDLRICHHLRFDSLDDGIGRRGRVRSKFYRSSLHKNIVLFFFGTKRK